VILFFGPTGSGKSMQGQILAYRHGWKWLSMGQLLRDAKDPESFKYMQKGELVPNEISNRIVFAALDQVHGEGVVLDGYPRALDQARDLVEHNKEKWGSAGIDLAIVLDVDHEDIMKRLALRDNRAGDDAESITRRLGIYLENSKQIFDYFTSQGVEVIHINGNNTVGQVHDEIEAKLMKRGLVESAVHGK